MQFIILFSSQTVELGARGLIKAYSCMFVGRPTVRVRDCSRWAGGESGIDLSFDLHVYLNVSCLLSVSKYHAPRAVTSGSSVSQCVCVFTV